MDKNAYLSDMMTCHDDEATRTSPSEGLEEGEVEGETLLIVESEDQASVDLSHDQSGDSVNSDEGDTSWTEELSYYCERCQKWLPTSHTREQITYLKGDNFFKFTCSDCSEDGKEQFERLKLTWQQVVMLAMYNLSLEGTGRQGYFRWKEDICAFIEKHWSYLLGNRKKTSTWWSTVAGCLSVGSPLYFRSGAQEFGEPGWWKLVHNRPPMMKPEGEKLSVSSLKAKGSKLSVDPIITVEGLRKRVSRNPVESAMELKEKRSRTQEAKEIRRAQKEAAGFLDRSTSSTPIKFTSRNRHSDIMLEKGEVIDFSSLSSSDQTPLTSPSPSPSLDFSAPGTPASHSATPSLLSEADLIPDIMPPQALFHDDEELEGMIDPGIEYIPPSDASGGMIQKKMKLSDQIKQELMCEEGRAERLVNDAENHSSTHGFLQDQGSEKQKTQLTHKDSQSKYTSIGIYEEKLLLRNLEAYPNATDVTPEARRLRRKLIVRKTKRENGLPLFNLDDIVNSALILVDQFYGTKERNASYVPADYAVYKTSCQAFRILDRYQTKVSAVKEFQHRTTTFWCRLVGSEDTTDHSIISPYTSRVLKPYIRFSIYFDGDEGNVFINGMPVLLQGRHPSKEMDESPATTELRTSPDNDGSAKKGKGKGKGKGAPKEKGSPKGSAKEKGSPKGSAKGKGSPKGSAKGKPKSPVKKEEEPDLSMASMGHPEIFPLVLTEKTQEIFNCSADVDVTAEHPYKLLKKEDIINDMKTRAAISDFHPIKKVILDYPGEELLLVFDRELKYGQIFYLVATEEAKENILNPPEPEEEEEIKEGVPEEIYKPPVRKPWVSLGSEKEIEEESVRESTRRIKYMISRPHKEFGIRVRFQNRNATLDKHAYVECMPYEDKNFTIRQLEKHIGIQVVPEEENTGTQTKWTYPKNATTQYYPREFSEHEKEAYLSSEELKNFIVSVASRVEVALQQNEIMNVFFDDWKALAEEESGFAGKSDVTMKEYQSFTDLHYLMDRTVSCICWHPTIYGIIVVAVTERLTYEERVAQSGKLLLWKAPILFWSFADPIHPQLMLECPEDIYCFEFSPSDPNIIVGGCLNGQVVLWDISEYEERLKSAKSGTAAGTAINMPSFMLEQQMGKEPHVVRYCAVSSIEYGHKSVITDIHWLPDFFEVNRMGTVFENRAGVCVQLMTCSPDCTIYIWDLRVYRPTLQSSAEKKKEEGIITVPPDVPTTFKHLDLAWKPLIKINLPKADTSAEYSPIRFSFREEHYHTKIQDKTALASKQSKEAPVEKISYAEIQGTAMKPLKLLEHINTSFFVGTEDGEVLYSDWKMERDGDSGRLLSQKPSNIHSIHDGLVHTVQRSPFFKDIILTIGGWNFAIWKEGVTGGPLLKSNCAAKRYTIGHWSLSRPGVFFIGREDGNVDIWDLLEKTHEASQTQNISIAHITYIKPWIYSSKQHFLAVADDFGTLHILEISWSLIHPSSNEHSSVLHYFEREVKHLEYFEQRQEFRDQERVALEYEKLMKRTKVVGGQRSRELMEEQTSQNYVEFLDLEKTILVRLGLLKEPDKFTPSRNM